MPLLPHINGEAEGSGRVPFYAASELIRAPRGTAVGPKKFSRGGDLQAVMEKAKKGRYVN